MGNFLCRRDALARPTELLFARPKSGVGPELKTLSLDLISVTSKRCLEELGQKRRELKILAEEVEAISAQRMGKLGFGDFATLGVRKTVSFVRVVY